MKSLPKTILSLIPAFMIFVGLLAYSNSPFAMARAQQDLSQIPTSTPNPVSSNPDSSSMVLEGEPVGEISLLTSPPRIELKGKPGETLQATIKVKNVTSNPETIESKVFDFIVGEDGKTPILVTEEVSGRWASSTWFTLSPEETRISANGSETLDVLIQIPDNALPGGHYAVVVNQPKIADAKKNAQQEAASQIYARIGTLIYITVEGPIHEEAFIRNFTAPKWLEFGPVHFSFDVENRSDVHMSPGSTIEVRNLFGKKVATVEVGQKNIFPFTSRNFEADWDVLWGFGPYMANLTVPYGSQGAVVTSSIVVWLIPYRILLSILVILATFLVFFIAVRRHIAHRNNLQTQHIEVLEEKIKELEKQVQDQ